MKSSPTKRTLKYLREKGYVCAVTEHWNAFAKIRQDLFGFIDILALHEAKRIVGIQCTTGANMAARIDKIKAIPEAVSWALATGRIYVIGWRKLKGKEKKATWQPRVIELMWKGGWMEFEVEL